MSTLRLIVYACVFLALSWSASLTSASTTGVFCSLAAPSSVSVSHLRVTSASACTVDNGTCTMIGSSGGNSAARLSMNSGANITLSFDASRGCFQSASATYWPCLSTTAELDAVDFVKNTGAEFCPVSRSSIADFKFKFSSSSALRVATYSGAAASLTLPLFVHKNGVGFSVGAPPASDTSAFAVKIRKALGEETSVLYQKALTEEADSRFMLRLNGTAQGFATFVECKEASSLNTVLYIVVSVILGGVLAGLVGFRVCHSEGDESDVSVKQKQQEPLPPPSPEKKPHVASDNPFAPMEQEPSRSRPQQQQQQQQQDYHPHGDDNMFDL